MLLEIKNLMSLPVNKEERARGSDLTPCVKQAK